MKDHQILICPNHLIKYMGEENYHKFIDELRNRINNHKDYKNITNKDILWIIAEWGEYNL